MSMPPKPMASIRSRLSNSPDGPERFLWGAGDSVRLDRLVNSTIFGGRVAELAGRSVLITTRDQFAAALALIELDGIARRLVVCTPDLPSEHLPGVVAKAGVDAIVSDGGRGVGGTIQVQRSGSITPSPETLAPVCISEW